jgi:hypothetical protein
MTESRRASAKDGANRLAPQLAAGYCLLGTLVCLLLALGIMRELQPLQARASTAMELAVQRKPESDKADAIYADLLREQESNRAGYSGQQAVEMSARVMTAKAESIRLRGEYEGSLHEAEALQQLIGQRRFRIVPLACGAALHFLALVMVLLANPGILRRS